jgi:hypothetical protein
LDQEEMSPGREGSGFRFQLSVAMLQRKRGVAKTHMTGL